MSTPPVPGRGPLPCLDIPHGPSFYMAVLSLSPEVLTPPSLVVATVPSPFGYSFPSLDFSICP
jgi:hypothetical protein